MFTIRTHVLAATAALALGSVTACGDGSGPSSTTASSGVKLPTVSKAVFAEQGNAVCRASAEAIGSKFRAMSTPPKPDELKAAYDNMLKESYKFVGEVLEIGAPKGQERALLDLLVEQYKVTQTVEKSGQAEFFSKEDSDPWAKLSATLVKDFDLMDCGHDG